MLGEAIMHGVAHLCVMAIIFGSGWAVAELYALYRYGDKTDSTD